MSTDTLAVTDNGDGTADGIAIRTATVIDAADVHRDWRHRLAETAGVTAAVTSGGALTSVTLDGPALLTWTLAVACAPAAVTLLVAVVLMAREGRRWTIATDPSAP